MRTRRTARRQVNRLQSDCEELKFIKQYKLLVTDNSFNRTVRN